MIASEARQVAVRWVNEVASGLPGFLGAFFHGSILEMPGDDPFPATSDVDVGVVFAGPATPPRLGKERRDGVLVEGASISIDRLATAEQVLGDYRLAPSFRVDGVIADPTGHLGGLQQQVGERFSERRWILTRCTDARSNCLHYVRGLRESRSYATQATCWLFAEGNLTHVLLAAGLENPTVRRRYSAARGLLATHGRLDVHEALLTMLGSARMRRSRVEYHLAQMAEAFDHAASVIRSEFPFRSDLSHAARPVAIAGSRELIDRGEHREAMFWIVATHARCMAVLESDGPTQLAEALEPGFRALLADLGVGSYASMQRRALEIERFLPEVMDLAEELVSKHPEVTQAG